MPRMKRFLCFLRLLVFGRGEAEGEKNLLATSLLNLMFLQKACSTDIKTEVLLTLQANNLKYSTAVLLT